MNQEPQLVTVFRSADESAGEDAREIRDLLAEAGLSPVVVEDDAPGVPSGACEVRVPAEEADRADEVIAAVPGLAPEDVDPSHELDLEAIFDAVGVTAEMEAMSIRGVLEANGIPSFLVGAPQYPNLRFLVRVPKKYTVHAQRVLAEARAAGPRAAEEAQRASEG
jgi:hypothetical protein